MLLAIGVLFIVAVFTFLCVAAWHKRIASTVAFTLGFLGIVVGIVITNLPNIAGLVLKDGEKNVYGLELQRVQQAAQQVETKATQVQTDATEVRQMKEQIQAIVERLEKGEQAAQESSQKLKDIEQQQAPRRLSDEQKRILEKALSPFRGQKVSINSILGNDDSREFVEDFKEVFVRAEWNLGGDSGVRQSIYAQDPIGIELHLNRSEAEAGRVPQGIQVLAETLIQLGILQSRSLFKNEQTPVGEIEVRIGWKS